MSGSRIHHVGYVVASIAEAAAGYQESMGLVWDGRVIHDPLQMVRVTFLTSVEGGASVELVEPAGPRSPVNQFLAGGGGLHHICLEVENLSAHVEISQAAGAVVVRVPLAAVAFHRRKIAWIKTAQGQLIELLQCGESALDR